MECTKAFEHVIQNQASWPSCQPDTRPVCHLPHPDAHCGRSQMIPSSLHFSARCWFQSSIAIVDSGNWCDTPNVRQALTMERGRILLEGLPGPQSHYIHYNSHLRPAMQYTILSHPNSWLLSAGPWHKGRHSLSGWLSSSLDWHFVPYETNLANLVLWSSW